MGGFIKLNITACIASSEALVEATGGFEPPHKGFADLSLTTWVRRHFIADSS
jgi:hypothetical protein